MFFDEFKKLRKASGFTQETFADAIGVKRQSVQKWEANNGTPDAKRWELIEKTLGLYSGWVAEQIAFTHASGADYANLRETAPQYITNQQEPPPEATMSGTIGISGNMEATTGTSVPVISWVQAGEWNDIADAFQPGDADDFVLVCRNVSKHTFALRISGNSMAPEFLPGETIIIDPAVRPETGKFVVAKTENGNGENGEATFKKFERDGNKVFLIPLNDKFDVMDMTGIDFRIVGCMVFLIQPLSVS